MLFALTLQASPPGTPLQEVEKLLDSGKPDMAVELMRKEADLDVKNLYLLYNYGLTLYRAGRYDESIAAFQHIESTEDKELQSKATLQLGNAQYRLAQKLLKMKPAQTAGAILSLERALGYYQNANETLPSKESEHNKKVTTVQVVEVLVKVASSAANNAQIQSAKSNLALAEHWLREALQGYQRAKELDPLSLLIPPLLDDVTKRLVKNLEQQAVELGKVADAAVADKAINDSGKLGRRQRSIAKFDEALQLDPNSSGLTAEREEQVKKLSTLLTDQAEALALPILPKPAVELSADEQGILERARTKLNAALALEPANTRAADLRRVIFDKLEASYVAEGEVALNAAEAPSEVKDKLELVKTASDQFQKALNINPQNQRAKADLENAQAQLPGLYAAVGREDLDAAKALQPVRPWMPAKLSTVDLHTAIKLLSNSVDKLGAAVFLKPDDNSYRKDLEEAQDMLDACLVELDVRNAPPKDGGDPPPTGLSGGAGSGGVMFPLGLSNYGGGAKPEMESKIWDNKIKDW